MKKINYAGASIVALLIAGLWITLMIDFVNLGMPWGVMVYESEEWVQKNIPFREELFELNGLYNVVLGKTVIKNGNQIYVKLDNGQLVYTTDKVDMSSNINKVTEFSEFCESNDMRFMYVNLPSKPFMDEELTELGYDSFANANANELIDGLVQHDVNVLDIRESIKAHGIEFYSLYYKTDHHWNADAGLMTAQEIVSKLNKDYGYELEYNLLENENFERKVFENCWLGETGRVMTKTYAGLDDFILIKPLYDTSMCYDVDESDKHLKGDFSVLLDENIYNNENNDIYKTSWHYSYLYVNYGQAVITNNYMKEKPKILLIKDSFALVVAPYLALTAENVTLWDMRYNEDDLKEYILNSDFDVVIVAYTQTSLKKEKMFKFIENEDENN